jgi:hypothetical protein
MVQVQDIRADKRLKPCKACTLAKGAPRGMLKVIRMPDRRSPLPANSQSPTIISERKSPIRLCIRRQGAGCGDREFQIRRHQHAIPGTAKGFD